MDLTFDDLIPKKKGEVSFDDLIPQQTYEPFNVLPFREDATGVHFDSNAGLLGSLKRAVTLPGEVMRGEVDPMSQEGIGRAAEMGLMLSPMTPSMRTAGSAPGVLSKSYKTKPKVPTAAELKASAKPVYNALDNSGTEFSLKSVDDLSTAIQNELLQQKFIGPEDAPKTFTRLQKLQNAPEEATSVPYATGINALRKQLGRRGAKPDLSNPDEPFASSYAARRIMEWFEGGADNGVVAGPSIPADLLKAANKNYAAGMRSEALTSKLAEAELRAAAANSGKNIGNSTRQKIAGLLLNKNAAKERAGFTEGELAALEKTVVEGTFAANATRDLGNMLGGGGGLGGMFASTIGGTAGYAGGGPVGGAIGIAAPAVIGRGSKAVSNALTKRALGKVDKATRMRSPLYEQMAAAAPTKTLTVDTRQAIAKALLAQMLQNGQYSAPTEADLMLRN